jgi:hypothetical protein
MGVPVFVEITGLCLFVPKDDTVHVLLPATSRGGAGHHDTPHIPVLIYETKYEGGPDNPNGSSYTFIPFEDEVLSFEGLKAGPPTTTLDRTKVVPLHEVYKKGVPADVLSQPPGALVTARVDLKTGTAESFAKGVEWEFENLGGITMSPRVSWLMESLADTVDVKRGAKTIATLRAYSGAIRTQVYHVPTGELPPFGAEPPDLGKDEPPPHWDGYLRLLGVDPTTAKKPKFKRKPLALRVFGMSPMTCMVAQAPPE